VLTFALVVTDNLGLASPADTTVVTVTNEPPVASAGPDQPVLPGAVITLDGSGSADPDGHLPLSYGWLQSGGETVTLSGTGKVSATFTAPVTAGVLTFTLSVTDSLGLAGLAPDPVVITVQETPPEYQRIYLPFVVRNR
jgi:hypothetical protein